MRQITFDYSLDAGQTWQTSPITVSCLSVRCTLIPSIETEGGNSRAMGSTATECQKTTARHYLDIVVSSRDLNPSTVASGQDADTNWLYLQKWACAPLRMITNASTATDPNLDGWDLWETTNTAYLNLRDTPEYTYEDLREPGAATANEVRTAVFHMKTKDAYTIT